MIMNTLRKQNIPFGAYVFSACLKYLLDHFGLFFFTFCLFFGGKTYLIALTKHVVKRTAS